MVQMAGNTVRFLQVVTVKSHHAQYMTRSMMLAIPSPKQRIGRKFEYS
jgi:hypothetical protein